MPVDQSAAEVLNCSREALTSSSLAHDGDARVTTLRAHRRVEKFPRVEKRVVTFNAVQQRRPVVPETRNLAFQTQTPHNVVQLECACMGGWEVVAGEGLCRQTGSLVA